LDRRRQVHNIFLKGGKKFLAFRQTLLNDVERKSGICGNLDINLVFLKRDKSSDNLGLFKVAWTNHCKKVIWETGQHWQRKEVLFPSHVTLGLILFCQFKYFCSFNCLLLLSSCSCMMCMMAQVLNSISISLQMWLFSWRNNVTPPEL